MQRDFDLSAFRRNLARRTAEAVQDLRRRIGSETLYAFALVTSGESDFREGDLLNPEPYVLRRLIREAR